MATKVGLPLDENKRVQVSPSWNEDCAHSWRPYQIVLICLQIRIVRFFVTRTIPADIAVAPISRSEGSAGYVLGSWLARIATLAVIGKIAVRDDKFSIKASTVPVKAKRLCVVSQANSQRVMADIASPPVWPDARMASLARADSLAGSIVSQTRERVSSRIISSFS